MVVVPPGTTQCRCVEVEHLPRTQILMTINLPEGYQIVKVETEEKQP